MKIERLAHTCFLIDSGTTRIVIDPAMDFYNNMWMFGCARPLSADFIRDVSAIFLSHSHTDHFHLPTLAFADKSVPIFVPADDRQSKWPIQDELMDFGFSHVFHLENWEHVSIGDIHITGVPAPESIEGIPQMSFIVHTNDIVFLNAVDTLEDLDTFKRISDEFHIDVMALPVNCSYNYLNIRNQMSPGTALHAVNMVKPRIFVPTGVNFCHEKLPTPIDVPWFPFDNSLNDSETFKSLVPPCTQFLNLNDDQEMTLYLENNEIHTEIRNVNGLDPTPEVVASNVRGRIYTNLISVGKRDNYYFGLRSTPTFSVWRKRWTDCLTELDLLGIQTKDELDYVAKTVPIDFYNIPLLEWFPKTINYLRTNSQDISDTIVSSLLLVTPDVSELDYVKSLHHMICTLYDTDSIVNGVCGIEYRKLLQTLHLNRRPQRPTGIDDETIKNLICRQVRCDFTAADYVYPRFNEIYEPMSLPMRVIAYYSSGEINDLEAEENILIMPVLKQGNTRMSLSLVPLREHEAELARAIIDASGDKTINELCSEYKLYKDDLQRWCRKLLQYEPHCMEFHWLPETGYSWSPENENNKMNIMVN